MGNRYRRDRRFQFSLRRKLIATSILGVIMFAAISYYRDQVVGQRPRMFMQAIQNWDLAEVDRLLTIDAGLVHGYRHLRHSQLYTPVQLAVRKSNRNPKILKRILEENPDVNERSTSGRSSALHYAVESQIPSVVHQILRCGADVNALDPGGDTPLHLSAGLDRDGRITKLLLAHGADQSLGQPSGPLFDGMSPIHIAANCATAKVVGQLIDAGADLNGRDQKGRTPLHLALLRNNKKEISQLLIERGASPTAKDHAGLVPGQRMATPPATSE